MGPADGEAVELGGHVAERGRPKKESANNGS